VCPWQKFAPGAAWPELKPRALWPASLGRLLSLDQAAFDEAFRGSALHRSGRDRLVRNACVAAGNSRDPQLIPALRACLADASPLVRGHAAWALGQVAGRAAVPWLAERLTIEPESEVRGELQACLRDA
jgi:epoxyqueuosine reductase